MHGNMTYEEYCKMKKKLDKEAYKRTIRNIFVKQNIESIKKMLQLFDNIEDLYQRYYGELKFPYLKNFYVDIMAYKLVDDVAPVERRMLEIELLKEIDEEEYRFFKLNNIVIPKEILLIIFSFLKKSKHFLDGCINSKWQLLSLRSFDFVYIDQENMFKIPIPVLRNVKKTTISCSRSMNSFQYILSNIKTTRKLVLCCYAFGCLQVMNRFVLSNIQHLSIRNIYNDIIISEKNLPNLKELTIIRKDGNFENIIEKPIFKKLKSIKFKQCNDGKYFLPKWLWNLSNLEELKLSHIPSGYYNFKLTNLRGLCITFNYFKVETCFLNCNYRKHLEKFVFTSSSKITRLKIVFKDNLILQCCALFKSLDKMSKLKSLYIKMHCKTSDKKFWVPKIEQWKKLSEKLKIKVIQDMERS